MNIFRLPSYFRIFGIFFFLLASGFSIHYFIEKGFSQNFYKRTLAIAVVILGIAFWSKKKASIFGQALFEKNGKFEISSDAHFYANISTQGFLHFMLLLLLSFGFIFLKKDMTKKGLLLFVACLDLFFSTQLNISSTVVSDANPMEINQAFHYYSPEEFPLPPIDQPFKNLHKRANFDYVSLHINLNHFHKIPSPDGASPVYFNWSAKAIENGIFQKTIENPLVFGVEKVGVEGKIEAATIDTLSFEKINLLNFSPNQIEMESNFSKPMHLVFLQHYHPDWKVFINEKEASIIRCNETFLAVKITEGKQKVRFIFEPRVEITTFYISLVSWALTSLFLITMLLRRRNKD